MGARLIFIEGRPGAGKSTTASKLGEWLQARGEPVRVYREMDDDNPIRTRGTDAMRANHPHVAPLPDTGEDGFARDPSVYDKAQWDRLAAACKADTQTRVLESRYMQNSVQPRYLMGAPARKVVDGFSDLAARVAPAAPLLIYLRPANLRAELQQTLDERGDPWRSWLLHSFSSAPFAAERGLRGFDALVGFYEAWEAIGARLCALHRGPLCVVEGAHRDWDGALQQIHAAVRPPPQDR